jgi:O-antigen/teichoic acid export membrane protein
MTSVTKRVAAGMGANAFAQALTIGIQLASLPIFLRYWDISRYGLWLMISAVPSYFAMADLGMVTAAANKMTMALGRGDIAEANTVFQSALLFMLITCGTLGVIIVPVVLALPLPSLRSFDQRAALCVLILSVLFGFFGGLSEAIFRATGRYGLGTTLANLIRLAEWCGSIIGLVIFGSLSSVAIGGLSARLAGLAVLIALSADGKSGIKWNHTCAKWTEVRAMTKPALSFMLFPMSNALGLQGMTLLAGYELGPIMLVTFNTYRTLARIAVQVAGVFSLSLQPEFSRSYGMAGAEGVVVMYRRGALLGIILAVSLSVFLYFSAPLLLRLWTHGKIGFQAPLMLLMLVYAAVAGAWYVPRMLLMSTNKHSQLAFWCLTISAISLVVAAALCRPWKLEGLVTAMILSEVAIAIICARLAENVVLVPRFGMTKDPA